MDLSKWYETVKGCTDLAAVCRIVCKMICELACNGITAQTIEEQVDPLIQSSSLPDFWKPLAIKLCNDSIDTLITAALTPPPEKTSAPAGG